jgi:hypothetical protein
MTRNAPRYSAWINDEGMGIYVMRDAGICGPGSTTNTVPADTRSADEWLAAQGFKRSGEWTITNGYNGLTLDADVVEA